MLSQIEACSLPLLYKLSVALPAGKQTYPKKDKTNLRIDCGFLLFIFGCIKYRELKCMTCFLLICELFLLTLTLECTIWGSAFLIGINPAVCSYTTKETSMVTS